MVPRISFEWFIKANKKNTKKFSKDRSKIVIIQQVWWGDETCQIRVNGGVIACEVCEVVHEVSNGNIAIMNPEALEDWRCFGR